MCSGVCEGWNEDGVKATKAWCANINYLKGYMRVRNLNAFQTKSCTHETKPLCDKNPKTHQSVSNKPLPSALAYATDSPESSSDAVPSSHERDQSVKPSDPGVPMQHISIIVQKASPEHPRSVFTSTAKAR
jgi:hypothetical protein